MNQTIEQIAAQMDEIISKIDDPVKRAKAEKAQAIFKATVEASQYMLNSVRQKPFKKALRICRAEKKRQAAVKCRMAMRQLGTAMQVAAIAAMPVPRYQRGTGIAFGKYDGSSINNRICKAINHRLTPPKETND